MKKTVCLHDKVEIEQFLRRNTFLHIYAIGDLDDFFWPHTTWYALKDGPEVKQVVLIYTGMGLPVLLAQAEEPVELMEELLRSILHLLPRRLYTHLSEGLAAVLAQDYQLESHGVHNKMALTDPSPLESIDTSLVVRLSQSDLPELEVLYEVSYPGNWFDPRMLETGHYYGLRRGGELCSVAGIHVYSPRYRVAALGNITTHPQFRGHGLGTTVCAKLCQSLLPTVDHIGLNVKADNAAAIACYQKLGFTVVASYQEVMLELKRASS